MKTIEYHTVDKSSWGDGPWQSEPDKKQWCDETTGLPCLIVRGPSGSLCGYVGVPADHPAHGKGYDDVEVDAHGGLTFADKCAETPTHEQWRKWRASALARHVEAIQYPKGDAARLLTDRAKELEDFDAYVQWHTSARICHRVEDGEDDDVWWFGFDCAHAGDLCPAHESFTRSLGMRSAFRGDDTYKDLAYVTSEVQSLARQLVQMQQ